MRTRPRAEPKPSATQSKTGVATDLGALGAEDPAALRQPLAAHVAKVGTAADDELSDRVEDAIELGLTRQVLLPDLGPSALLEHNQGALVEQSSGSRLHALERDRRLESHPARHIDE